MRPRIKTILEMIAALGGIIAVRDVSTRLAIATGSRFLALFIPSLAMLAAVILVSRLFGTASKETFNVSAPSPRHIIPSVIMGAGGYYLIAAVTVIMGILLPSLTNETDSLLYEKMLSAMSPFSVIIAVVVVPAVCEELIFRGFFLTRLQKTVKPFPAMLISGFIFGAVHFDLYKLLPITVMGTVLAYIAYKTGSFVITALLHMLNNAISVIELARAGTEAASDEYSVVVTDTMGWFYAAAYLALGGVLIYAALKIFKTITLKGWKSKLIIVLCAAAFFGCNAGAVFSTVEEKLDLSEIVTLEERTVKTESLELETARLVYFDFNAAGGVRDVDAVITLTDGEGREVYKVEGTNAAGRDLRPMPAGRYTLTVELAPAAEGNGADNCLVSCRAIAFYQIEFQN
ncbi:MAG: CPBP family intramembrane metalloprotease [Clostridia bacterium]|nr:CPBP family intramembrane metalloprotease [Clostridia bacterium]